MEINYKIADENDAYGISYVSAYSWNETYKGLLPDDYLERRIKSILDKVEKTKKFVKDYAGSYIVVRDGKNVIGILAYTKSSEKDYGYLEALYVLKKYQGMGIGKHLFKMAVNGLKNMGYNKMKLECMVGNNTLNFYKKYLGKVSETILYPINESISVKADVVLFEDLNMVLKVIN